ncbi:hypothetical protein [Croceicoccus mobilis]|nr:hypothetical protein [Croceicoccus mobilis]
MTYRVIFYRDDKPVVDAAWTGSLAEAQLIARDTVNFGHFECVEILSERGDVVLKRGAHTQPA